MFEAQVIALTKDKAFTSNGGKTYRATEITLQRPPGQQGPTKPRVCRLFKDDPVYQAINALNINVGDTVVYTNKDDQFKSIASIMKKDGAPAPDFSSQQPKAKQQASSGGWEAKDDHPDKAARISRSTALKAGVDIVCAMMNSGKGDGISAKVKPEVLEDMVISYSKAFETYVIEGAKTLSVDTSGVGDVDDLPPDEDNIPY